MEVWWKSRINECLEVTEKEMENEVKPIRKVFTFVAGCFSDGVLGFSALVVLGKEQCLWHIGKVSFHLPASIF